MSETGTSRRIISAADFIQNAGYHQRPVRNLVQNNLEAICQCIMFVLDQLTFFRA